MRQAELRGFYRTTARLLDAGLSLPEALSHLAHHARSVSQKRALAGITERVFEGEPLHEALHHGAPTVPRDHHGLLAVGEASGSLSQVLYRLSDQLTRDGRARKKLISAALYPGFVLSVLAAAGVVFSRWVLPGIAELVAAMDPATAQELRSVARRIGRLVTAGVVSSGVLLSGGVLWRRAARSCSPGAEALDWGLLQIPFVGGLLRSRRLSRLFFTVETLLEAGSTAEDAFSRAREPAGGGAWEAGCARLSEALRQGRDLTDAAVDAGIFPPLVLQRFAAVEAGASLTTAARDLRLYFEQDVEMRLEALTRAAEPVLIAGAGLAFALFVALGVLPVLRSYGAVSL